MKNETPMNPAQDCPLGLDLYDPEVQAEIYSIYESIHSTAPVFWSEAYGGHWVVAGYEEIFQVGTDWKHFSSAIWGDDSIFTGDRGQPRFPPIQTDPPEQQHWRRLLNPHFSPAGMVDIEPGARAIASELIDCFIEKGEADLVKELGNPLPGMVFFSHLVQVPLKDLEQCRHWVDVSQYQAQTDPDAAMSANIALGEYLYKYLENRRTQPPVGDVVDTLLAAEMDGHPLSVAEIMPVVMILVFGGLETTSNAIANALHHLALNVDDHRRLVEDSTMIPTALEEFLRYEGSLHGLQRIVTEDVEVLGHQFHMGDKVLISYAGANRDPREFSNPSICIIDRKPNRHVAFGAGVHRCVGSNLARLNFRVTIEEVLRRLPDFQLRSNADLPLRGAITRGYTSLPVTFTPGPRLAQAGSISTR